MRHVLHAVNHRTFTCRVECLGTSSREGSSMTVLPPPGWTFAAAVLTAVFSLLAMIFITKTPKGHDKHYAYIFASLMAGIGGGQLGVLIAYANMYPAGHTYSVRNPGWTVAYIIGEWTLIIMAFATTTSRLDKFPSNWPLMEFALQGFANLYLVSLTCNQLAAIAPKAQTQDVLGFGKFVFAVTTIVVIITAMTYLSMWTERRFLNRPTATTDGNKDEESSVKVDMVKRVGDGES